MRRQWFMILGLVIAAPGTAAAAEDAASRQALFGELHVHTQLSFDAFIFGVRATPDDAYRYARGEAIKHPAGFAMQLDRPLDFIAVTDHAMYLGMVPQMADPDTSVGRHPISRRLQAATTQEERLAAFYEVIGRLRGNVADDDLFDASVVRSAWQEIVEAAERNYQPGKLTTFTAYEYTLSGQAQENLHRNVIFRDGRVPSMPFSSLDSRNPEDLWGWMDQQRAAGREALAIPHNSNGSNGLMFEYTTHSGAPIDAAYAELRLRNEPLVEITQVKGTSETHPLLSPNDEWADFEIFAQRIASDLPSDPSGSYVRDAYRRGLAMEALFDANPYRFGLIASSDSHVGAGAFNESDYWGKVGLVDASPELRGSVPVDGAEPGAPVYDPGYFQRWSAAGLAGVWAEENTRESIYAALRRKETFATSGPRMRIRLFAGYDLGPGPDEDAIARAYRSGVAMGSELPAPADGQARPGFLVWALRDPASAGLQRLQIVKGWIDDGETFERVYDVACAAGAVDPVSGRCPDSAASVDLRTCTPSGQGAAELRTLWQDPDAEPGQRAFYYARVLEEPTCRWSTWDANRAGVAPRPGLPALLQERAWSSPIWVGG
ncbi:MAG: DUF3604 domain-containing protein [Pseudomonadales bacterium]